MMNYNDGEIHIWNGGECPVHSKSLVRAWHRSGKLSYDYAIHLRWNHWGDDDIIAFQVTKPYTEPKTIWVNEYHHGGGYAYTSEEEAKSDAGKAVKRIAVKYVEAKE